MNTLFRHGIPLSIIAVLFNVIGCAGYKIGMRTLYCSDIHNVHVPIFESDSYRRFLGERLTEAVVKEIELKTPYKVVDASRADTVLYGRIARDTKRVVTENRLDEPRDIELNFFVQVRWVDRREMTIGNSTVSVPSNLVSAQATNHAISEAGQSIATAQQEAIQTLATEIVAQMEVPW